LISFLNCLYLLIICCSSFKLISLHTHLYQRINPCLHTHTRDILPLMIRRLYQASWVPILALRKVNLVVEVMSGKRHHQLLRRLKTMREPWVQKKWDSNDCSIKILFFCSSCCRIFSFLILLFSFFPVLHVLVSVYLYRILLKENLDNFIKLRISFTKNVSIGFFILYFVGDKTD